MDYYLLEKEGENSKCGILDLGKCMDSDENSTGENVYPSPASMEVPPTYEKRPGDVMKKDNEEAVGTTNSLGEQNQVVGSSDNQIMRFITASPDEASSAEVGENKDTQNEKETTCESSDSMFKNIIDMNVEVSLHQERNEMVSRSDVTAGRNEEKSVSGETLQDLDHTTPYTTTDEESTKSNLSSDAASDSKKAKSLDEILDHFCDDSSVLVTSQGSSYSDMSKTDDKELASIPEDISQSRTEVLKNTDLVVKKGVDVELDEVNSKEDIQEGEDQENENKGENQVEEEYTEINNTEQKEVNPEESVQEGKDMYMRERDLFMETKIQARIPGERSDTSVTEEIDHEADNQHSEEKEHMESEEEEMVEENIYKEKLEARESGSRKLDEDEDDIDISESSEEGSKTEEEGVNLEDKDKAMEVEESNVEMESMPVQDQADSSARKRNLTDAVENVRKKSKTLSDHDDTSEDADNGCEDELSNDTLDTDSEDMEPQEEQLKSNRYSGNEDNQMETTVEEEHSRDSQDNNELPENSLNGYDRRAEESGSPDISEEEDVGISADTENPESLSQDHVINKQNEADDERSDWNNTCTKEPTERSDWKDTEEHTERSDWKDTDEPTERTDWKDTEEHTKTSDWNDMHKLTERSNRRDTEEHSERSDWKDNDEQSDGSDTREQIETSDWKDTNIHPERSDWKDPEHTERSNWKDTKEHTERSDWKDPEHTERSDWKDSEHTERSDWKDSEHTERSDWKDSAHAKRSDWKDVKDLTDRSDWKDTEKYYEKSDGNDAEHTKGSDWKDAKHTERSDRKDAEHIERSDWKDTKEHTQSSHWKDTKEHTERSDRKDTEHTEKSDRKDTEHTGKGDRKDTEHAGKSDRKDTEHAVKSDRKDTEYSGKSDRKDTEHAGKSDRKDTEEHTEKEESTKKPDVTEDEVFSVGEILEGSAKNADIPCKGKQQKDTQKTKVSPQPSKAKASPVKDGSEEDVDDPYIDFDEESIENISRTIRSFSNEKPTTKKEEKKATSNNQKEETSTSKRVIMVKTAPNVERVKRKLEEILEKSKGEEDAAIAELQRMKKEKTDILNAITTEMEKLKAMLVKEKQG